MAEGLCRDIHSASIDCQSAGIERHGLNPLAIKVMAETDIDISSHVSKNLDDLGDISFDYVITVCGHANETCPVFPALTKLIHWGFDDPPKLAAESSSEEEALVHYRRVRDEIKLFTQQLPRLLNLA